MIKRYNKNSIPIVIIIEDWDIAKMESNTFEAKPRRKNTIATVLIRNVVLSDLTENPRLPIVQKVIINVEIRTAICLVES